jgi:type II secretory pathway component PulL
MQTVAHRTPKLPAWAHRRVAIWLLGAVLVAAVATTLALALIGSGDQQADPGAGAAQPAAQQGTPLGGALP